MNSRARAALVLGLCAVVLGSWATQSAAQWVTNGVAVGAAVGHQQIPASVADGAQGVVITWFDSRGASSFDIYAQRLDATGTPQWTANGLAVCTAPGQQVYPRLVSDGAGGAIVTWSDGRSGPGVDIYAQHVLASGAVDPAWPVDGRALSTGGAAVDPVIIADGAGGAIVAWEDGRNGTSDNAYAQHVLASGVADPAWPVGGRALSTAPGQQENLRLVTDGAGGAIVTWEDHRTNFGRDVYAQHVLVSGAVDPAWPADGLGVGTAAGEQLNPTIVAGGGGSAIITWEDPRSGTRDIYAQHVLLSGAADPAWPAGGLALCALPGEQGAPVIDADGAGGAIVAWYDGRSAPNLDIYAQHVLAAGAMDPAWPTNGRAVCTAVGQQIFPVIVADGAGGALVSWQDKRNGTNNIDTYAQRLNASGTPLWLNDGVVISTATGDQTVTSICSNGHGGAIMMWQDLRAGSANSDIYAQHVSAGGDFGFDYTITATAGVNGSIAPSGAVSAFAGVKYSFTVRPNAYSRIQDVLVDGSSVGAVTGYTFTNVVASHSISASFAVDTAAANAGWVGNGTGLSTGAGDQQPVAILSDGTGGAFIAWKDSRSGNFDVYVQRVNAAGQALWTSGGVAIATGSKQQYPTAIVSDGAGGAIIAWYDDDGSSNQDVYAQRVSGSGVAQWGAGGIAVSSAAGSQTLPAMVPDGASGAILTWQDARGGAGADDIYAQRLNAAGAPQWTTNGVALCTAAGAQSLPTLVSAGGAGAVVTWSDPRGGGADIYAQLVSLGGAVQWNADGVAICTSTGDQLYPRAVSDRAGGAIVTWQDGRGANLDVYAQRVGVAGAVQWAADGVGLCTAAGDQQRPEPVADGAGGAIVTWQDRRGTNDDIYVQRVDGLGNASWTANGVGLCTSAGDQQLPKIVSDGAAGAIVTWTDNRNAGLNGVDIFARRINAAGVAQWTVNGNAVTQATDTQQLPVVAEDGQGGAVVGWSDRRSGSNNDFYAQRVSASGVGGFDFIINASSSPDGTISPVGISPRSVGVFAGSTEMFTITPAPGSSTRYLVVDNALVNSAMSYTFSNLAASHSITASFTATGWVANGTPVCTAPFFQNLSGAIADGAGGMFLAWEDQRNGAANSDIYVQHLDADGIPLWTPDGVAACAATLTQQVPKLIADGSGGVIVTWEDLRDGVAFDVFAQRVSSAGVPLWATDGVAIASLVNQQAGPQIVPDGAGGAIIAWHDSRGGDYDIYAQRVDGAGIPQWPVNGVALSTAANSQSQPVLVSDGSGGAIVAWYDDRSAAEGDLYAQRVNSAGIPLWATDGVPICTAALYQQELVIASDGAGGAIFAWYDQRDGFPDIYAQRVNGSGAAQWAANGVVVCNAAGNQESPAVDSDGAGGAVIAWADQRTGTYDIYAQRLNASGAVQWTANGVSVSAAAGNQLNPFLVSDGGGGAIVAWTDRRAGFDIFAQRVTGAGAPAWTVDGVAVSVAPGSQQLPQLCSDGAGGALAAWFDSRAGSTFDIYAQRIQPSGTTGPDHTLASSVGPDGIIFPHGVTGVFTGANKTFVIAGNAGFRIQDVLVDGASVGAVSSYTFSSVSTPHTIAASFTPDTMLASAGWAANGVPLCSAPDQQFEPVAVPDGAGGAIVAWFDLRTNGVTYDIYAQRVNASGVPVWARDGIALCTASGSQIQPRIASDGAGGAIVVWNDDRNGGANRDVYAQRVNASGVAQWATDGIALCTAAGIQGSPRIVADGSGGAIVTWVDVRAGNSDVYAQRVSGSGVPLWTANGVVISSATGNQNFPEIVADAAGGAILAWFDYRAGPADVYAQRVNGSGAPQWTTDGVAVCTAPNDQLAVRMAADGAGGTFVTWRDLRGGSQMDVFAQRLNGAGVSQWTADGVALCTITTETEEMAAPVVGDGSGGAIVVWPDARSGQEDLYAQRLNAFGVPQWTANGIAVCTAANDQINPAVLQDGAGGVIVAWVDGRSGFGEDIYAQRVNVTGTPQWTTNGVAVSAAAFSQLNPTVVPHGLGGAMVFWDDGRSSATSKEDIYAQRVTPAGALGFDYTIAASHGANGLVSPGGATGVFAGSSQSYAITPQAGYQVQDVIADAGSVGAVTSYTFANLATNHTLSATFIPRTTSSTITASSGPEGQVSPAGAVVVTSGSSATFAIKPNAGSRVQDVLVDNISVGAVGSYTFTGVSANHSIVASFVQDPSHLGTGWVVNGGPLCAVGEDREMLVTTSDGTGGTLAAWRVPIGTDFNIFAQRLDAAGAPLWGTDGVAVCLATGAQQDPVIASDGAEGAIVVWTDERNGALNRDIYARRIRADGVVQWAADGVAVCNATGAQGQPSVIADGAGGAFVSWSDWRSGNTDIYVQRLNGSGAARWAAQGMAVSTEIHNESVPVLAADGAGGAIVAWHRQLSDLSFDLFAQRVNAFGAVQWTTNGVAISVATGDQSFPQITSDDASGAVIAWTDTRGGTLDVYAQRISDYGVPQWTANGVALVTAANSQDGFQMAADGAGGAVVAWSDLRNGNRDVYAQRLNYAGIVQWTADGVAVCTQASEQLDPRLAPASGGGAIVSWTDARGADHDIYAQRLNGAGLEQWITDGMPLCNRPNAQEHSTIVPDGAGGAIATWLDDRAGSGKLQVFAQRVSAAGVAGFDHTVTPTAGNHGSITPPSATGVFDGSGQSFTLVPNAGYHVKDVFVDGGSVGAVSGYTFTGLVTNHTIVSSFAIDDASTPQGGFLVSAYAFEDPAGACNARGWVGEDLVTKVYAHVSNRFVVNGAPVSMGSKALWFGADSTSAPAEVAGWVTNVGYGNNWSQRFTSPPIDLTAHPAGVVLAFDATVALGASAGLQDGDRGNEFLGVQGLKSDGTWAFLVVNYGIEGPSMTSLLGPPGPFTDTTVTGTGVFRATVALNADGNEFAGLAANTRLRIVVQTDASGSPEDGGVPATSGAAVVDNITVRENSTDIVPPVNCEDGTIGAWTLSARNGTCIAPGANTSFTRDVAPPATSVALRPGFDPNDASCAWTFLSPGDTLANGVYARLVSPWFALPERTRDLWIAFSGQLNTLDQRRNLGVYVRGKRTGAARPGFVARYASLLDAGAAGGDLASAFLRQKTLHFPQEFAAADSADSVQLVFEVADQGERAPPGLSDRPTTRLPFLDDIRLYQFAVDTDLDGVPDAADACADESASGQDADANGCVDANATLRHVESWGNTHRPIHYRISQNGLPAIIDGSDLDAIRAAFASWVAVPGAAVPLAEDSVTTQQHAAALDGVNLITFEDDFSFDPNVIAVTPTTSFTQRTAFDDRIVLPEEIVDADMIFNPAARFRTGSTGPDPGSFDLQSVATHEAGHFLGISHTGVQDATMFPVLQLGADAASLEDDDRGAIAAAYPAPSLATDFATISGKVLRAGSNIPVPGAMVLAVKLAGSIPVDTTASDYTREDGSYTLRRLPAGSYGVRIAPLDGSVPGVVPGAIGARLAEIAQINFLPEWWSNPESGADDPSVLTAMAVVAGQTLANIDILTNTDVTPPAVSSISPAPDSTGIHIDTAVLIRFSEAISDTSLSSAFRLRVQGTNGRLGGRGEIVASGQSFVFIPTEPLAFDTFYEVSLSTALTDGQGVHLASPYAARFRTEVRPTLAVTSAWPERAPAGARVTLLGVGFDAAIPANNRVAFTLCGLCPPETTQASQVTPTSMVVTVPANAVSGPLRAVVGPAISNPDDITILPAPAQDSPAPSGAAIALGFRPSDVAVAADGLTAYAVGEGGLAVIDLHPGPNFRHVAPFPMLGSLRSIALTPDGLRALVTRRDAHDVTEVDVDNSSGSLGQIRPPSILVNGDPDAIALSPSGRRAYVSDASDSVIHELDTDPLSVTHGTLLRDIRMGEATLSGGIAAERTGRSVVFSTRNAGCRGIDLGNELSFALHATASAGGAAITPDDLEALFTDPEGSLLYAHGSLTGGSVTSGAIFLGGQPRDVAVGPAGRVAYVANLALNRLQAVNLDPASSGYHTLAASVATGRAPVAVAVSDNGTLIAVANSEDASVSLYSAGSAGSLLRVDPPLAMSGDQVCVQGTGNALVNGTSADVGETIVPASYASGSGAAFVVPASATQRATQVMLIPPGGARTLALPFTIVDPISRAVPKPTPIALVPPRFHCDADSGYLALRRMRLSPDGRILAVLGGTPDFCAVDSQTVDFYAVSALEGAASAQRLATAVFAARDAFDMDFSPDGTRLWVPHDDSQGGHFITLIDADPTSANFGLVAQEIVGQNVVQPSAIRRDPLGRYMYVLSRIDGHVTALGPDTTFLDQAGFGAGSPRSLVATRDGRYVIVGVQDRINIYEPGVAVLSSNPHPGFPITAVEVTSDGRRVVGRFGSRGIGVWNLDPGYAAIGAELYFGTPFSTFRTLGDLVPAPDGHGVLVTSITGDSLYEVDVAGALPVITGARLGRPMRQIVRSLDGRQLWCAMPGQSPANADSVFLYSVGDASSLALVSGSGQIDAPGAVLPLPVRVQVTDSFGHPQAGVIARFSLPDTSHGLINGATLVERRTNTLGEAEVAWTLPHTVRSVTMSITAQGVSSSLAASAEAVADPSVAPPVVLALGPATGSTGIETGTAVFARFSQRMNATSIASHMRLLADGSAIAGTFDLEDQEHMVLFRPDQPLPYSASCRFTVLAGALDQEGQILADSAGSSFTLQPLPALALLNIGPPAAPAGAPVAISGAGFSALAGQNLVFINGVLAPVVSATATALLVRVPSGAHSGPATVRVGAATSNSRPFSVLTPVAPALTASGTIALKKGIRDVAVTPDGRRAYITNPYTNSISGVSVTQLTTTAIIPVGLTPQSIRILPDGSRAYVANTGSNDVSVIDVDSASAQYQQQIDRIPVGKAPLGMTISSFGPRVIVVCPGDSTVHIIEAHPGVGEFDKVSTVVHTPSSGTQVTSTPDGTRAYVLTAAGVVLIDLASKAVTTIPHTPSSGTQITVTPDGTLLLVLSANGTISVVDIVPGSVDYNKVVTVPHTPSSGTQITVSPDGGLAFVSLGDRGIVYVFRIRGGAAFPNSSIAPGAVVTFTPIDSIPVGLAPRGLGISADGTSLLVANEGSGTVSVITIGTTALTARLDLAANTYDLNALGKWVRAYLEPPGPHTPAQFELGSIRLNEIVSADSLGPHPTGDHDQNGTPDLAVSLLRSSLAAVVPRRTPTPVRVTGVLDGVAFVALDTLTLERGDVSSPASGQTLLPSVPFEVQYDRGADSTAMHVALLYSYGAGEVWTLALNNQPNSGHTIWSPPGTLSDSVRVAIVQVNVVNGDGTVTGALSQSGYFRVRAVLGAAEIPRQVELAPLRPNPARLATHFRFALPHRAEVTLELYDVLGRRVKVLASGSLEPGWHELEWRGDGGGGQSLGAGLYFVRFRAEGREFRQRLVWLR